mgnify:CR=1 FL=1
MLMGVISTNEHRKQKRQASWYKRKKCGAFLCNVCLGSKLCTSWKSCTEIWNPQIFFSVLRVLSRLAIWMYRKWVTDRAWTTPKRVPRSTPVLKCGKTNRTAPRATYGLLAVYCMKPSLVKYLSSPQIWTFFTNKFLKGPTSEYQAILLMTWIICSNCWLQPNLIKGLLVSKSCATVFSSHVSANIKKSSK